MDGPGTVRYTLTYGGKRVGIHGRSVSHSGVQGYSDIGEYMSDNPCTTLECQSNFGLQSGGQTRHGITGQE